MPLRRFPAPPVQVGSLPEDLRALVPAHLERLLRAPKPRDAPPGDPLWCGCRAAAARWDGEAWICRDCSGE